MSIERRYLKQDGSSVRLVRRADKRVISGYASVFYDGSDGTEYQLFEGVKERIRPGAFNRALSEKHDVRGLFNHSADNLLGRSANGTLRLSVDDKGLRYEIEVDEADADHQRVAAKIERGDLTGSSFAFRATAISWEQTANGDIRWIDDLNLFDVGPVTYPAYQGTSTGLRSDDQTEVKREHESWQKANSEWRIRWLALQKIKAQAEQPFDAKADWLKAQKKLNSYYA